MKIGDGLGQMREDGSGPIRRRREQVFQKLAGTEPARLGEIGEAVGNGRRNHEPEDALSAPSKVGLILLSRFSAAVLNWNGGWGAAPFASRIHTFFYVPPLPSAGMFRAQPRVTGRHVGSR